MRYRVTWGDGLALDVTVRRFPWWLKWWPSRNVTFGQTVLEGGPVGMNAPTSRHEFTHCRQYHEKGWAWVWLHPVQRELEAHLAEGAAWPTYQEIA